MAEPGRRLQVHTTSATASARHVVQVLGSTTGRRLMLMRKPIGTGTDFVSFVVLLGSFAGVATFTVANYIYRRSSTVARDIVSELNVDVTGGHVFATDCV